MPIECKICFEPCVIPVSFTCFPCSQSEMGMPSCNSMTRVCLSCARRYLELDRPRRQRSDEKRCLFCRAVVNPRRLNALKSYTKDFLIMSMDPRTDYPCVHPGCPFTGTQMELDHHVREDCPLRDCTCSGCHAYIRFCDRDDHIRSGCPGYKKCRYCEERILIVPRSSMDDHLVAHHQMERCSSCHMLVHTEYPGMQAHRSQYCPARILNCNLCGASVVASDMENHYRMKIDWVRGVLFQLETQASETNRLLDHYRNVLYNLEHNVPWKNALA